RTRWAEPPFRETRFQSITVRLSDAPPTIEVLSRGKAVQRLMLDAVQPVVTFPSGKGPLLGLGEGGPQFDRRGNVDTMRAGQAGFHLATHGTRAPVQW